MDFGVPTTPLQLEFPDLVFEEALRSYTDEEEMRKAYQESISYALGDPTWKVLQLRPGCVDAICITSNAVASFGELATKDMHLPLPNCTSLQKVVLHVPVGGGLSVTFDRAPMLIGFVDKLKQQNRLALATCQAPLALTAVPSTSISKDDLEPFVAQILASMDTFCTRSRSQARIIQTEELDWIADIDWYSSKPGADDWVSLLVSAEGIQVVNKDPASVRPPPIPLNHPEWLVQSVAGLAKLLTP